MEAYGLREIHRQFHSRVMRIEQSYVDVTQVACIYAQSRGPVRRPQSGSSVSRRGCEVDTHGTPLHIPHRILVTTVGDDICHSVKRPQTRRGIGRGGEEVFWAVISRNHIIVWMVLSRTHV